MNRLIYEYLANWSKEETAKPLLLKGARQVGKTWLARSLKKEFKYFIEINFEKAPQIKKYFDEDLDVNRISELLSLHFNVPIVKGRTLIFFDEIGECENAIKSLRYFSEDMPGLHVIAAGSLVDFAIEKIGMPVGRINYLYVSPVNFCEYLMEFDNKLYNYLKNTPLNLIPDPIHDKLNKLVSEYVAIGGMPEALSSWIKKRNLNEILKIQKRIINTYRDDFAKYARKRQIEYLDIIFQSVPRLVGKKFLFSTISKELRSRTLLPALELLIKARVIHKVNHSSSNGIPLSAEINPQKFKAFPLDVGLMNALLDLHPKDWLLLPKETLQNRGSVMEAFVGQELLSYQNPIDQPRLFYWIKEENKGIAEVDYVIQQNGFLVPIEVKSGKARIPKSIYEFLRHKKNSKKGIIVSSSKGEIKNDLIEQIPFYAIFLKCF